MNIMTTRTVANFAARLLTGRVVLIALTEITVMGRAVIGVCGAALLRMVPVAPTAPRVTTRSNDVVPAIERASAFLFDFDLTTL